MLPKGRCITLGLSWNILSHDIKRYSHDICKSRLPRPTRQPLPDNAQRATDGGRSHTAREIFPCQSARTSEMRRHLSRPPCIAPSPPFDVDARDEVAFLRFYRQGACVFIPSPGHSGLTATHQRIAGQTDLFQDHRYRPRPRRPHGRHQRRP